MDAIRRGNLFLTKATLAFLTMALLGPVAQSHAADAAFGNRCEAVFLGVRDGDLIKTFEASQTRSQFVRDNARDYWNYARLNGDKYFGEMMKYKGLVVGDTHPGNFIVSPLAGKMRFFIADIKDAGHAPYILDLARLVMATQSVFQKGTVKTKETSQVLLEAYIKGLKGAPNEQPASLNGIFAVDMSAYNKMQKEYVEKQIVGDAFRMKTGKVEPIRMAVQDPMAFLALKKDIEAAVEKSFPGAKILDLASRPRERGGSKDLIRYWALVSHKSEKMIIEFKQIDDPATVHFGSQQETVARYQDIMETFWKVEDPAYRVIDLTGEHFWMRPKKTDVFRVPYKQKTEEEMDFLLDLAAYDAYYLGVIHARQNGTKEYVDKVQEKKDELREAIRQFSKVYASRLKDSIERLQNSGVADEE